MAPPSQASTDPKESQARQWGHEGLPPADTPQTSNTPKRKPKKRQSTKKNPKKQQKILRNQIKRKKTTEPGNTIDRPNNNPHPGTNRATPQDPPTQLPPPEPPPTTQTTQDPLKSQHKTHQPNSLHQSHPLLHNLPHKRTMITPRSQTRLPNTGGSAGSHPSQ